MSFVKMEVSTLASMISEIRGLLVKSSTMIQAVAVQAVYYSIADSNTTPAQQLYDALGTESRKDSLLAFLEKFGNLAWSKTEKKIVFFNREKLLGKEKALEWTPDYAAEVAAAPWSAAKAAPAPKSIYDCDEEVRKFIGTMEKQALKGGVKNHHMLDVIRNAYNKEQLGLQDAMFSGLAARAVEDADPGLSDSAVRDVVVGMLISRGCDKERAEEILDSIRVVD
jgi:hypothetical protein